LYEGGGEVSSGGVALELLVQREGPDRKT